MKIEQVALFGAGSVGGSLLCRQRENLDKIKVIVHGSRRERMEKKDCSPVGKHSSLKSGKKVLTLICSW